MNKVLLIVTVAGLACAAQGQVWNELGNAGDLPATANITDGTGPLLEIRGLLLTSEADMFCIYIPNPAAFRATTINGAQFDTQLFLFDSNGFGVTHSDDSAGVAQSTLTGQFVPSSGHYYIAISSYNLDPVDSSGALIWNNTPFGIERAPDGPGAGNAIAGWSGTGFSSTSTYTIFLEGAEYCIPTPGALALMGMGGLVAARRRRA